MSQAICTPPHPCKVPQCQLTTVQLYSLSLSVCVAAPSW